MRYFVMLEYSTEEGADVIASAVEQAENPSEALAQAVENLANTDYGPDPRIFYLGRTLDDGKPQYKIQYSPPNSLGVTEELYVEGQVLPCNLYRVEGREEVWAPTPQYAAELYVVNNLAQYCKAHDMDPERTKVPFESQVMREWPLTGPSTNWVIKVVFYEYRPCSERCESSLLEVRALVPATV